MTRLPGDVSFHLMNDSASLGRFYDKLKAQDLLWLVWPELESVGKDDFVRCLLRPEVYALGASIDGELAGCLLMRPFGARTLVGEIGVTAFRPFFGLGRTLFLNGMRFVMKDLDPAPSAFIGKVARVNRHILSMLASCGFTEAARLPGLLWHSRLGRFMEGALVTAGAQDILKAMED